MRDILRIKAEAKGYEQVLKAARAGSEVVNIATDIRMQAERKATELIEAMRSAGSLISGLGGKPGNNGQVRTLADLGVTNRQAREWRKVAAVPDEDYNIYKAECARESEPMTAHGLIQFSARLHKRPVPPRPTPPEGKYRCLVIDPPWPMPKIERAERPAQGDALPYETMTLDEIAELPIPDLAHEDGCHIYLWVTHRFLPAGLDLFEQWGVKYQCVMTWRKNVGITPFSWMYDTEHVLFGRVGNLQLDQLGLRLSFEAAVTVHSAKPDVFYERVLAASPEPRLEMFARQPRNGFTVWGNEVEALAV